MTKVKVWKKGFWRMGKKGNRIWVKGKYIEKEAEFPKFGTQSQTNTEESK